MSWWVFCLISGLAVIWTELIYRGTTGTWLSTLPQTAPLILIAQFGLFRAFNEAPHWFLAWAVFCVGSSIMRASAVGLFGDKVSNWPLALVSIAIMLSGAFLMKTALK